MGRIARALISRIEPKADAWFAKHGATIDDTVRAWVNTAPKANAAERQVDQQHKAFLRTARLGQTYWSPNGGWDWIWTDTMDDPELIALGRYEFKRWDRGRTCLITAEGFTSRDAIREAWPKRLLTCEPRPVPPKPTQPDPDGPLLLKLSDL